MYDTLRYAWKETRRRPLRALWIAAGYAACAGFAAAAFGLAGQAQRLTVATLERTGAQFIAFVIADDASRADARPLDPARERFEAYGNPTALLPPTLPADIERSALIRRAAPWLSFRLRWSAAHARTALLAGFDPADMASVRMVGCSATELVAGNALAPGDRDGLLLEQTFARAEGLAVGDRLVLAGRAFGVRGILSPGTRPAKADIYLALPAAMAVVETRLTAPLGNRVNAVLVDSADARVQRRAIAEVTARLGPHAATGGYGCFTPAGGAIGLSDKGMWLLALVAALGVAGSVARAQYAVALERRRDIGILKAIGWSDRRIGLLALAEAAGPAAMGAGAGCGLVLCASAGWGRWAGSAAPGGAGLPPPAALFAALALTAATAVLTGICAARAAARVRPADVLREV
jgi:ABC-type lipoprotein release transport system permease subunit